MGRNEDSTLADLDEISAHCIGIRQSVDVLAARLARHLREADADEFDRITNHSYAIQALYVPYRAAISAAYQQGSKMHIPSPQPSAALAVIEELRHVGEVDRETAHLMRSMVAPHCRKHHLSTVVLRDGKPVCAVCAVCWKEGKQHA
jgi:hypothetical protein